MVIVNVFTDANQLADILSMSHASITDDDGLRNAWQKAKEKATSEAPDTWSCDDIIRILKADGWSVEETNVVEVAY